MKTVLTIIFVSVFSIVYGQTEDYKILLDSAKILFKSENNNNDEGHQYDYSKVVALLEKVIELKPGNAEARYFLGYTYSRMNAIDARGMVAMKLDLLYKCSEQFEKVIELSPKYSDEIIILDPYSKLTAEWGSMAMGYLYHNKVDSAIWAFREGKKRGGFGEFLLEVNKHVLDACSKNSMLISSGDNFFFPLWYLQVAENYRADVSCIDISLLGTTWFPDFLSARKSVNFDLPKEVLDTIEYTLWTDSLITINNFSWTIKPSYGDQYLLRGDRVFLSLLKENKFQKDVFFTITFNEENRLGLKNYLLSQVFVDKLSISRENDISYDDYTKTITKALKLSEKLNLNSQDECTILDNFRYAIFNIVNVYLDLGEKGKAKNLMNLCDKFANEKKYPYQDEYGKKYSEYLRQNL
jgi:hypothetical protein